MKPISYLQTDKKWKNISYSMPGESTTIGKAGCGPTCASMVVATLINPSITPVSACAYSIANKLKAKGGGTYANFFPDYFRKYGIDASIIWNSSETSDKRVVKALKEGCWVIACMGPGNWTKGGHYILAYSCDDKYVYINDPASTSSSRTKGKLTQFLNESKYYIIVEAESINKSAKSTLIKECQEALGLQKTGVANTELLNRTVTIAVNKNFQHRLVLPVQRYLSELGYYDGKIHGTYDYMTANALRSYQANNVGSKYADGVITAKNKTWKKLLGLE